VSFVQRRSTLAQVHFIHVAKFLFLHPQLAGEEAAIDRHGMTHHEARGCAATLYHGSGDFLGSPKRPMGSCATIRLTISGS
jgi:hypothetical protein